MTYIKSILGMALLLSTITTAAHATDQIFLKNGDRLTGEILSRSPKTVRMQTGFGVLYIQSDTIARVDSGEFTMVDLVGQTIQPTPATVEQAVIEKEPTETPPEPTQDETGLWGAKWSGNANVGTEFETGNSDGLSLDIDAETTAKWNKHRAKLVVDYDFEEDNDVRVEDDRELSAMYDYFFAEKWFWNNQLKLRQDKIDNLDLRTEIISGLGYQFYDRDNLKLGVTFGPGFEREEYENQDAEDNLTANWSLDYEQAFYDDFIRLFHNHDLNSPTDDFSSFLFESESGVRIPLRNNIIATGEIEFDWNNDPANGEKEDDTTYTVKLGYEW